MRRARFHNTKANSSSQSDAQNLKFERADWTSFRTLEGLQQKAGVAQDKLIRQFLKELTDNALDEGEARVGETAGGYFVEDDGEGLDSDEVARLFSIARPLASTKMLRLPARGALGNGLRVAAGAVLASNGKLAVTSRGVRQELKPQRDGATAVADRQREIAEEHERPWSWCNEIAESPTLLADMEKIARRIGLVGESVSVRGACLTASSRLNKESAICLLRRGAPAGGKSFLIDKTFALIPADCVVRMSSGSLLSLVYYGGEDEDALKHRIVYVPEAAVIAEKNQVERPRYLKLLKTSTQIAAGPGQGVFPPPEDVLREISGGSTDAAARPFRRDVKPKDAP